MNISQETHEKGVSADTTQPRAYIENDPHRLIDHHHIAARLDMNEEHVRDRLTKRAGFPPAYRFGGARRWKLSEVLEWIEKQREAPARRGRRKAVVKTRSGSSPMSCL